MRPASGQAGHLTHPHARGADRRHPAVWLVVVVAGVVVLVGCSPPGEGGRFRGGDGVVRVGLLRPVTGTVAASGKDMEDGWNLYWRQHGNVVAGKRVQTVAEDDAGNPPVGLNKASLLVERYRVQVVVGPLLANVGLAVAELLNRKKVPVVMPVVAADDLTQRTRYPYVLRFAGWTASQETHPLGEWAFSQGWRTAVTLCADYTFGYEACGGFVNTFTDRGGRVLKQLWNPLGTPDVGAYLAEVRRVGPDVVFAGQTAGTGAVRILQVWEDFGLKGRIPLVGDQTFTEQSVLRQLHGDAAAGVITSGDFAEGHEDPATRAFVDAYRQAYGRLPSYDAAHMDAAAQSIATAIERMRGEVSDPVRFVATLRGVELADSPMGPLALDRYGNPVLDVHLRRVERGPYGWWNVPFKTYRDVSQFWAYGPAASPRHPVYAKTYQGADRWAGPGGEGCPTPRDQPAPSHGMDMEVLDAAAAPRPAHP